jgi:hypothetical protein
MKATATAGGMYITSACLMGHANTPCAAGTASHETEVKEEGMSDVKRYSFDAHEELVEDPGGEWVRHSDYQRAVWFLQDIAAMSRKVGSETAAHALAQLGEPRHRDEE